MFASRKIELELNVKEAKPPILNEQCVVYNFQCFWDTALRAAAGCLRSEVKSNKAVNVLALCSASVVKFRHQRMSALAYRISVILLHSPTESEDLTSL